MNFYLQFNMFSCMKISCTCYQHLKPQILNLVNTKNNQMAKNIYHFPYNLFIMDSIALKKFISYII
jgi:hypothetical protein